MCFERLGNRPMRAALLWQLAVAGVCAAVASLFGGEHAAISAALGGTVVILANVAYMLTVSLSAPRTVGATIQTMLRAEAVKVALIVLGLWVVFTGYSELVPFPLVATLILTVLLWSVALLYRD
jgi:F0F1-type ATP synthase assembly protein I